MGSLGVDPIIIIGAGLGGLAFAQGLHKASIPFKIFERGESTAIRKQGDLEEHIAFEREFSHYELTDSGVNVFFADSTKLAGSLLVGADGARSAVRRQFLPDFRLLDTKNLTIYGKTPLTPSFTSRMLPEALKRLSFIRDPQAGSLTLIEALRFSPKNQRIDQRDLPSDYMYWAIILPPLAYPVAEDETKRIDEEGAADAALALTDAWHPSLKAMIENQDRSQAGMHGLLSVDPGSLLRGWQPNGRVTILGDAAHAMMPSEANGTGTALKDAALLVSLIRDHGVGSRSVAMYEEEMRGYASEAVVASARIGSKIFGFGSLDDAVEVH